jgi:hypothetical protein
VITNDKELLRALELRAGVPVRMPTLSRTLVRTCGVALSETRVPTGYVARIWTGAGWLDETYAGVWVDGTLPGGAGAPGPSASVGCACETSGAAAVWTSGDLQELLRHTSFRGLLFALVTPEGDVCDVTHAPPAGALCALLEGLPCGLAQWLAAPTPLRTSWAASVAVTRWPWPLACADPFVVRAMEARALRHFWPCVGACVTDTPTTAGLLGWATAWSDRQRDAVARALTTAQNVPAPQLQYRVGAARDLAVVWATFRDAGTFAGQVD